MGEEQATLKLHLCAGRPTDCSLYSYMLAGQKVSAEVCGLFRGTLLLLTYFLSLKSLPLNFPSFFFSRLYPHLIIFAATFEHSIRARCLTRQHQRAVASRHQPASAVESLRRRRERETDSLRLDGRVITFATCLPGTWGTFHCRYT